MNLFEDVDNVLCEASTSEILRCALDLIATTATTAQAAVSSDFNSSNVDYQIQSAAEQLVCSNMPTKEIVAEIEAHMSTLRSERAHAFHQASLPYLEAMCALLSVSTEKDDRLLARYRLNLLACQLVAGDFKGGLKTARELKLNAHFLSSETFIEQIDAVHSAIGCFLSMGLKKVDGAVVLSGAPRVLSDLQVALSSEQFERIPFIYQQACEVAESTHVPMIVVAAVVRKALECTRGMKARKVVLESKVHQLARACRDAPSSDALATHVASARLVSEELSALTLQYATLLSSVKAMLDISSSLGFVKGQWAVAVFSMGWNTSFPTHSTATSSEHTAEMVASMTLQNANCIPPPLEAAVLTQCLRILDRSSCLPPVYTSSVTFYGDAQFLPYTPQEQHDGPPIAETVRGSLRRNDNLPYSLLLALGE